jgi:hypothetical protein
MSEDRENAPGSFDEALRRLPREIALERDLWPAISAQLESHASPPASRWLRPAAAALLLIMGSSLMTAALLRRDEPVLTQPSVSAVGAPLAALSFGPEHTLDLSHAAAREALYRALSDRIDRLPPDTRRKVAANLAEIRSACGEINAALKLKPGDPLLEELLLHAYQQELEVISTVNQIAGTLGARIPQTRMPL